MNHGMKQQQQNIEAENAAVRKAAWGDAAGGGDDEMGDNINLGEVTENHYHGPQDSPQQQQQSSGLGKTVLAAGLGALMAGVGATAPIMAWNYSKPQPEQTEFEDTNTKFRLGIYRPDPTQ